MKRDPELLEKRVKKIGMFFALKKAEGKPSKVAILEIAQALSIGVQTVNNDLAKYNKEWQEV